MAKPGSSFQYRADIDGLRAVAVLAVVLFHADVKLFKGGFVGVDVFFVISGYLITSIISREVSKGTFSFRSFYERRVRRLFPALFVVLVFSTVLAVLLLMPGHLKDYGQSLAAANLFVSNVLFWREAGYFDRPADFKPLLHTWSLSVEEQFYIFFPPLLYLIYRSGKRHVGWVIWTLILAAFGWNVWGVKHAPDATFYLPFARIWELLLGAAIALDVVPRMSHRKVRDIAALAGIGAIMASILTYSHDTPFPGLAAALPVVGTALVILARADLRSWPGRVLSWRPLVYVGLLSYSLYLWHWPLLVFARYYHLGELSVGWRAAMVLLSFGLAAVSLHVVERPFRERRALVARARLFATAAALTLVATSVGVALHVTEGLPGRLSTTAQAFAAAGSPLSNGCGGHQDLEYAPPREGCVFGPESSPSVAVWGDSHAAATMPGWASHFAAQGKSSLQMSYAACPPLPGLSVAGRSASHACRRFNREALAYLTRNEGIDTVVLAARWSLYLDGFPNYQRAAKNAPRMGLYLLKEAPSSGPDERRAWLAENLKSTIDGLVATGKEVVLFYPVPEQTNDVPTALARLSLSGRSLHRLGLPLDRYLARNDFVLNLFDELVQQPGVRAIKTHEALCPERRCLALASGRALYTDANHLNPAGIDRVLGNPPGPLLQPRE